MTNSALLRALRAFGRGPNIDQRPAPGADSGRSTVQSALDAAGLDRAAGPVADIGATIERALSAAGLTGHAEAGDTGRATATLLARRPAFATRLPASAPPAPSDPGEFASRSYSARAGTRAYKLYVPSGYPRGDARLPLVVMLHGCTQSADDFAAGTGMNALAEQHGFLVAYPEQAGDANPSRCWNWFRSGDQQRDSGEPSLIAGITREIVGRYRVDEGRIYVAGMSAGAAMAVVLGANYPDLYAAVGAHSGLPYGSASDIPSALAAMKNGGAPDAAHQRTTAARLGVQAVPTIVFHGDGDATVAARNARAIVDQAVAAFAPAPLLASTQEGSSAGRRYLRTVYADGDASAPRIEHWIIRGAGHAWSGGCPAGSYTDIQGPDASAEFIRFFRSHAR